MQSLYLVDVARPGTVEQLRQVGMRLAVIAVRHREVAVVGGDEA